MDAFNMENDNNNNNNNNENQLHVIMIEDSDDEILQNTPGGDCSTEDDDSGDDHEEYDEDEDLYYCYDEEEEEEGDAYRIISKQQHRSFSALDNTVNSCQLPHGGDSVSRIRIGWEISTSECFRKNINNNNSNDNNSGGEGKSRNVDQSYLTLTYEPAVTDDEFPCCTDLETFCKEVLPSWNESLQGCEIQLDTECRFATNERYLNNSELQQQYFEGLETLGKAFGRLSLLRFLRFVPQEWSWMGCEDDERLDFNAVACFLKHVPQIKQLDTAEYFIFESENTVAYEGPELASFAAAIENHPSLEELSFDFILNSDDNNVFQNALLSIPKLRSLAFNSWESEEQYFFAKEFLQELLLKPSVRKFLVNGGTLSLEQASTLCDALGSPTTHLESLIVGDCAVPDNFPSCLAQATASNRSLKSLHLDECKHLAADQGLSLGKALGGHSSLEEFQLTKSTSRTEEQSAKWAQLLTGLSSSSTLSRLKIKFSDWNDSSCQSLEKVIQRTPLEALEINGVWPQERWLTILPSIRSSTLKSLTLNEHQVLSHAISFVSLFSSLDNTLKKCTSLEQLKVRFTECISLPIVTKFVRDLELNSSTLQSLDLFLSTSMRQVISSEEWLPVVEQLYGISRLKINWHCFHDYTPVAEEYVDFHDDSAAGMIKGILEMNRAGRKYVQSDTSKHDKEAGVKVLKAAHWNLSCLYLHIRENPFLCYLDEDYHYHHPTNDNAEVVQPLERIIHEEQEQQRKRKRVTGG